MSDLISREAVLEIVNSIKDCISIDGYWAILERVKALPPAEPQEWISVKDRLPEKSDVYWVTVTDTRFERNLVHAFAYDINSRRWANGHLLNSERVIAWMKREVPSPYKGE